MSGQDTSIPTEGYLIDLDGTIYVGDSLIPGAADFVHELRERGVPHRFVTNVTSRPRSAVLEKIRSKGLEIDPESLLTAPIATKNYLDREGIGPCFFLTRPRLIEDFDGHPQVEEEAEAVVVGDMGNLINFQHLNTAFRCLQRGARLVTMSRSLYFRDTGGLSLDAGAFVALLEKASGQEAVVTGKPAPAFFDSAVAELGLSKERVAMIGDDLFTDVGGAQDCGLQGILVLSGKTDPKMVDASEIGPDHIAESVAGIL